MTPQTLASLLAAQEQRRVVVLVTRLSDGAQFIWPDDSPAEIGQQAEAARAGNQSRIIEHAGQRWFLQVQAQPDELIVVGAVHIAQALVPITHALGLSVTLVDPRAAFNTAERFPHTVRRVMWPRQVIQAHGLGPNSAVVVLAHDPKIDDPALEEALRSEAFYIGALGSRKSHAARLQRLAALGHAPQTLARIRGPVGLAIGAVSAAEIALSIVAEIVAVRRGAALGHRP